MERRLFYVLRERCHSFPLTSRPSFHLRMVSAISSIRLSKRGIVDSCSPSPSSGWDSIDPSLLVEEESIPTYRPEKFYPVHIGEIFNHKYQVVGKLGYGSSATVWLCRDLS